MTTAPANQESLNLYGQNRCTHCGLSVAEYVNGQIAMGTNGQPLPFHYGCRSPTFIPFHEIKSNPKPGGN